LNFVGKFDAKLHVDGSGAHPVAHHHIDSVSSTHAPSDAIIIPDADLLFNGDFKRSGVDLIVSRDDHELVVPDYFKGEKRAALASPDGARLNGDIINALAGHVEYAQADGSAGAGKVIGHVTKLTGTATAIRNGVSIILNQGDNVEKGDVVQSGSGSTLGVTFIDGTVFGLSANARMVLNEMIYDPNGSSNSSLISLVAGTISFVAGQTAKHGDMKIDTPVATMGIRGTAVLVEIEGDAERRTGAGLHHRLLHPVRQEHAGADRDRRQGRTASSHQRQ
jgi:fibronectin-binding autotransporter adhesin